MKIKRELSQFQNCHIIDFLLKIADRNFIATLVDKLYFSYLSYKLIYDEC